MTTGKTFVKQGTQRAICFRSQLLQKCAWRTFLNFRLTVFDEKKELSVSRFFFLQFLRGSSKVVEGSSIPCRQNGDCGRNREPKLGLRSESQE